jgi:hypothetical protein
MIVERGLKANGALSDNSISAPNDFVRCAEACGKTPNQRIEDPALRQQRSETVDDAQMVLWSAEILERSEFEVFEQAYQAWYRETCAPPPASRSACFCRTWPSPGSTPTSPPCPPD